MLAVAATVLAPVPTIDATDGLALDQVPVYTEQLSVVLFPIQTVPVPVIAGGTLTDTTFVTRQPVGNT